MLPKTSQKLKIWTLLTILSLGLTGLAHAEPSPVDQKLREKLAVQVQEGGETCRLDDGSVVKLLYLGCIAARERDMRPSRDFDCLNPNQVVGRLITESELPIRAPAPIFKARQQLHGIFAQVLAENPDPQAVYDDLRSHLTKLEQCRVSVDYRNYSGHWKYETDLADALGLSLNEQTMKVVEDHLDQSKEHPLSHEAIWRLSRDLSKMHKVGARTELPLETWFNFFGAEIVGPGDTILRELISVPSEWLYRRYGDSAMTEETIRGCEKSGDASFTYLYKATSLWRTPLSPLVPGAEKAAIPVSDLVLDAQVLNYSLNKGSWHTERRKLPDGQSCPKPVRR